jgi:N-acetylneuraminate synthase
LAIKVSVSNRLVGDGEPCLTIAEIGINHNGEFDVARKLISTALLSGCNAVKFRKRTISVVYTAEDLTKPPENPFGPTNGDLKRGLELGEDDYRAIDEYCKLHNISWFASCWDKGSVDFIGRFNPLCFKIASASLTDDSLLRHHCKLGTLIILSTGTSTLDEIDHGVEVLSRQDLALMHTTSTYPSKVEELNLAVIRALKRRYEVPVGYSGHEVGLATTVAAVALGACMIERHISLDRAMWGSDQAASVELQGFARMVRDVRAVEQATGDGVKRVYDSELPVRQKLRRVVRS